MTVHGTCSDGFEGVRAAFERGFTGLGEVGAAACIYRDGHPVVDLWWGLAKPGHRSGVAARDTLVQVYSVTKPFAAFCLLLLVDEGRVQLDAPVARYWPEFAQAGKEHIPVRWLLTHQSGLLGLRDPSPPAPSSTGKPSRHDLPPRRPGGSREAATASMPASSAIWWGSWCDG